MLTNSWEGGDDLAQLQFVQQGGFTCSIQTHCRNTNTHRHTQVLLLKTQHIFSCQIWIWGQRMQTFYLSEGNT